MNVEYSGRCGGARIHFAMATLLMEHHGLVIQFAGLLNCPSWISANLGVSFGMVVAPPARATASSVFRICSSGDGECCSLKSTLLRVVSLSKANNGQSAYCSCSLCSASSLNAGWKIATPVPMPITVAIAIGKRPRALLILSRLRMRIRGRRKFRAYGGFQQSVYRGW